MTRIYASIDALILSISIVQLANGYLGTLVSIRTAAEGFAPLAAGIVLASYFGGYTLGAAFAGRIIRRVGHIRTFAVCAGLVAAAIVLQPIFPLAPVWAVTRAATGFGCAGLFLTAESWLNSYATATNRGAIFAVYMVATNTAFGGGQFLINLPSPGGYELFSLAAALFCIALIPVGITRANTPSLPLTPKLGLWELGAVAPVAIAGCAASGLVNGAFYTLLPAYAQTQGMPASSIAGIIATAIFGGIAFQFPVGRLSDLFDRRLVAAALAAGLAVTAFALPRSPNAATSLVLFFILGGFMATIYPVAAAHANDRVDRAHAVATSSLLILILGISSFLGPIIGAAVMARSGIDGVFAFIAVIAVLFTVTSIYRTFVARAPRRRPRPLVLPSNQVEQQRAPAQAARSKPASHGS